MDAILFTGFPGFLGSALLPRVLARAPSAEMLCLVQPRYIAPATARLSDILAQHPEFAGRVHLLEGDIVQPDLGLGAAWALKARVVEIFHLAAVCDMSAGRELAMRVNLEGTRHMLHFAEHSAKLRRFHHVSTCHVSGRFPGIFSEDMLQEGQTFNNWYEESKNLAEAEVQRSMRAGLPVTIYRPAAIVGDSTTGATQKYDGPYFVMQWLLRQPRLALMPVVGDCRRTPCNVVPRNFVADAIGYLSGRRESLGRVYQLADAHPLTMDEMLTELGRRIGSRMMRLRLPLNTAKASIEQVPGVSSLLRIPSSALDYFAVPTHFGTSHAQEDLAGSGIECPSFRDYSEQLVSFMRAHPEMGSGAMV